MATTNLRSPEGADQGTVELPTGLFDAKIHRHAMWQVVTAYLTNQRQGTSQVKTRGMVSGGGKKPFRRWLRLRHGFRGGCGGNSREFVLRRLLGGPFGSVR